MRTVAALDIGTTKICCFIAEVSDAGRIRVTGMSHHASAGIKGGLVVNMTEANKAVLQAVHAAEQLAGQTIGDVIVSINGNTLESRRVFREMTIGGGAIRDADMRRLVQDARVSAPEDGKSLVHAIPAGFTVDGSPTIHDPRGMYGQMLGVKMHLVSTKESAVRNLANCIDRSHLTVKDVVAAPYAAGLASLVEDERNLGTALVDMGGGTTTIAVFYEGAALYVGCIPVGGNHITSDIARGLSTPLTHAERLKTLFGSAIPSASDERELIDAPQVGEDEEGDTNRVPKSFLVSIIAARCEEIFELVRQKLEGSGVASIAGQRVVLTGGASQLPGVREVASKILGKQVRLGRPLGISGLAEATGGPAFATAAGLLHFAVNDHGEARATKTTRTEISGGVLARVGGWFRENF